jgi:hypothetical protein
VDAIPPRDRRTSPASLPLHKEELRVPRPPTKPDRSEIAESELPDYDAVIARTAAFGEIAIEERAGSYFGALVNSPRLAALIAEIGRAVRARGNADGGYSHADREWVDQVVCADWHTNCVLSTHIPDAVGVGVRLEAIKALRAGREDELTPDERDLTTYIREVVGGTVSNESYERLEARFGKRGAVEYTIFIAFLMMTVRLIQALRPVESSDAEIDELVEALRTGSVPTPDYAAVAAKGS